MDIGATKDFFSSLSSLSRSEQKRSKETIFKIKNKDKVGGLRYHKIEHPSNSIFSYSVNKDIRIISHQSKDLITILYIGHHDESYNWIRKRKFIDTKGGIIRIVITNETIKEEENPLADQLHKIKNTSEELHSQLKYIEDDDQAIEFISNQPLEIQDELLEYISTRSVKHQVVPSHFIKLLHNDTELAKALDFPLELWRIFLHPTQEQIINTGIDHSVFLTGGPGTGKTVCLVHKIKKLEQLLKEGECIVLTTFKTGLQDYLIKMLKLLDYNEDKTFVDDIAQLKLHHGRINSEAIIDGLFQIENNDLYYFKTGRRFKVRHLLLDEYQDFRRGQINAIKSLVNHVSFTLSFDYSQAIYRNVKNTVQELDPNNKVSLIKLNYSYRINSEILRNLKKVVKVVRVLSNESERIGNLGLRDLEEELIENAQSAFSGNPILMECYTNKQNLNENILNDLLNLKETYSNNEIVVTAFFDDLFKNLSRSESFHIDYFPVEVRNYYKYAPTLKGKEFKAGIVILDDTICQMLNMNRSVFVGKVDTEFKGGGQNYRLNLNLLYVALSRFRDFLKVYYPAKYEIILKPILN